MDNPIDPNQALSATTFAVLDVETTGLSAAYGHRVCEVGCLRVRGEGELDRFESLVDPERPVSPLVVAAAAAIPGAVPGTVPVSRKVE